MNRRSILTLAGAALSGAALTAVAGSSAEAVPASFRGVALDHVALNVRDFDGMIAWYRDKLGFHIDVSWKVTALNGKRIAYLVKDAARIEIIEANLGADGLSEPNSFLEAFARTGFSHVCFAVESIDPVMAGLEEEAVPTFVKAATYDLEGTPYRRRVGFVKDPEGNVIEFGEPLVRIG